jgi:dynein heavy chain
LIFNNFSLGIGHENRDYDFLIAEDLKKYVQEALNEYNENNAEMPLVLFQDAMEHVCRISRIIMSPSGHALLVGVGGMGK